MRKLVAQLSFPLFGQRQAGTERFDLGRQRIQRGLHAGRNFGSQTFDLNGGAIVDVVVRRVIARFLMMRRVAAPAAAFIIHRRGNAFSTGNIHVRCPLVWLPEYSTNG